MSLAIILQVDDDAARTKDHDQPIHDILARSSHGDLRYHHLHSAGVGLCCVAEHRYQEAIPWLDAALSRTDDGELYWELGRSHWRSGDKSRAELVLRQGLASNPDCVGLHYGYSAVMLLLGHPKVARYHKVQARLLQST